MESREVLLKQAENELYAALIALQSGDLPTARSSSARAASRITEAHQSSRRAGMLGDGTTVIESAHPNSPRGIDKFIKNLTQAN